MASLSYMAKTLIQNLLRDRGYRIERTIDLGASELDIFELLVSLLDPNRPDFTAVQVGANDGSAHDPINKYIKRHHWRAVLLEPLPAQYDRLRQEYGTESRVTPLNFALSDVDSSKTLYTLRGSNGELATFDRKLLATRASSEGDIIGIPVRCISVPTLLREQEISHVDLLVVDTEGYDYRVLCHFIVDSEIHPRMIRFEHLHLSSADRSAAFQLLGDSGYQLVRQDIDTIAIRTSELRRSASQDSL